MRLIRLVAVCWILLGLFGCITTSRQQYEGQTYASPGSSGHDVPATDPVEERWDSYEEVTEIQGHPDSIVAALAKCSRPSGELFVSWDISITGPSIMTSSDGDLSTIVEIHDPQRERFVKSMLSLDEAGVAEVTDPNKADAKVSADYTIAIRYVAGSTFIREEAIYYEVEQTSTSMILGRNSFHISEVIGPAQAEAPGTSRKTVVLEWR